MRREERLTIQGPVKKQQPGGMSHRGAALGWGEAVEGGRGEGGGGWGQLPRVSGSGWVPHGAACPFSTFISCANVWAKLCFG